MASAGREPWRDRYPRRRGPCSGGGRDRPLATSRAAIIDVGALTLRTGNAWVHALGYRRCVRQGRAGPELRMLFAGDDACGPRSPRGSRRGSHASQMHYNGRMKTATIPAVRVEPQLREEVESLLGEGETVSEFVEAAVRASVQRRRAQAEFIERGLRSRQSAQRTGEYVAAEAVVDTLQRKLDAARKRAAKTRR